MLYILFFFESIIIYISILIFLRNVINKINKIFWENNFGENLLNYCLLILFKDRIFYCVCVKFYLFFVEYVLGKKVMVSYSWLFRLGKIREV